MRGGGSKKCEERKVERKQGEMKEKRGEEMGIKKEEEEREETRK